MLLELTRPRSVRQGLKYMHENHFVHLDIKPENVMCVNLQKKWVKLIDFGLTRKIEDGQHETMFYPYVFESSFLSEDLTA